MRESVKDIIAGTLLFFFAAIIFIHSFSIGVVIPIDIGSGFFPKLVAAALALSSLPVIAGGLRRYAREKNTAFTAPYVNVFGVVASTLCIGVYISLLNVLGFFLSSILYLFAQFSILAVNDRKNMIRIGVLSCVIPLFVYGAFVYGFDMILPESNLFYSM